jgi:hypothetical protein
MTRNFEFAKTLAGAVAALVATGMFFTIYLAVISTIIWR